MRSIMRAMLVGAVTGLSVVWLVPGSGASSETPPGNEHHQTASPEAQSAEEPQPVPPPKDPVAQCLQDSMNSARTALGLEALPEIPSLLAVAQLHSDRMASQQIMHHSSDEIFALLPAGWRAYGENVVYGKTCEGMFEAFLNSEPHRNAILRPDFNFSGIAVSYGVDNWTYATMVFLNLPLTFPTPPAAPAPAPQPAAPPAPAAPAAPPEPAPVVAPPPPVEVPAVGTISLPPLPAGSDTASPNEAAVGSQAGPGASVLGSFRQAHPPEKLSGPGGSAHNGAFSFQLAPAGAEISFDLRDRSEFAAAAPAAAGPSGGPSGEMTFDLEQRLPEPEPQPSRMS